MTDGTGTDYEGLLEELGLDEAACVTAVTGATEAEVIRLFGGDPDRAQARVLDEELAEELPDDDLAHIAVARAGSAVVVVEYNGFQGSREEVLRPLSRLGGRAASAYWNIDALSRLSLAEDGFVLSAFEMLMPEHRHGTHPEAWDPHLSGLALGEGWGAGLAAVVRATGARLDTAWARGTHLVTAIEEVPRAMLPQALEDSPLLAEEPFAGYLARLEPGTVPEMERYGAELAARYNELADEALCTLALAVLDGCGPPEGRDSLRTELAARAAAARAPGPGGEDRRAAEVWQTLGDLLAREAGARVEGPPPMFHLVAAMTPRPATETVAPTPAAMAAQDRFWLLHALYDAARRGTPG
ncbi:DUF6461 domain-containing protein [Streptomyces iconiensis]|uniref:DUF6461 domain-containing protein n=1 Tax=Streptomyces iconiensis TaxID=1384038 RepID=A0ABT6ZT80_9ACTN|nr:DUF6461 domain-containing protein [Streptomyces iconiensis]MDJ1132271.1 DUF6461 domain-containing protein [Streptomyces iconiensis]